MKVVNHTISRVHVVPLALPTFTFHRKEKKFVNANVSQFMKRLTRVICIVQKRPIGSNRKPRIIYMIF